MTYNAVVTFNVIGIEEEYPYRVHEKLNNLIDQLCTVKTDLIWEDVNWTITESDNK